MTLLGMRRRSNNPSFILKLIEYAYGGELMNTKIIPYTLLKLAESLDVSPHVRTF